MLRKGEHYGTRRKDVYKRQVLDSPDGDIRIQPAQDVLFPLPEVLRINNPHPGFEERDLPEGYKTGKSCL